VTTIATVTKKKAPSIKTVGIREFRAKLSEYVRVVKQGDMVQVTDRGQVVACLVSPENVAEADLTPVERARRQMLADGFLSRLGTQRKTIPPLPKGPGFTREEVDAALDWTRGDR
jgi:prevent-host-death family protein